MNTVDQATLDANTAQIDFLTGIIRAYRMHEEHCPAFNPYKGDFANTFQSFAEKACYCWLDKHNTSEPGAGFGHYDAKAQVVENRVYVNKYFAYRDLIDNMGFSEDKEDPMYWGNDYMIVPITYKPAKKDENDA